MYDISSFSYHIYTTTFILYHNTKDNHMNEAEYCYMLLVLFFLIMYYSIFDTDKELKR